MTVLARPSRSLPEMTPKYIRTLPAQSTDTSVSKVFELHHVLTLDVEEILSEKAVCGQRWCGCLQTFISHIKQKNKLHGQSPRANYTDRATAACRRSDCQLLRIKGVSVTDPYGRILGFLGRSR
jgi:hypothetical protein